MKIIYIVIILIFSGYNIAFANKIFQGALTFYEQKKYDEAIILFERAQKTEKLNNNELAELLYKLSKSYTYKKKYDAAIENLKILIEKISDNKYYIENSVYLLANLYNIKGDTVRANALKNYLFKNFPQSIYTQEKYWLLDSSNNISTTDGQITAQQKITQPQQISKPTDIPIKSDISADAVKIIPEIESELIPIKTNVEYIILDFDKSTLKSMIEHFSSITKIQYIIDFYNFNDYITVKSESRINVKFLPVFLNKILEEYKYAIKDFGNGYKINKTVIFAETYIPIHKFYFIMQIDNEILRKIQLSLDDLKYPNIKYFVYKEFNYFIIQAEDSETLTKFLDALKISTEKIDRYITKTFKTNKVKSTEIVNYLKTIMLSKLSAAELFKKQQITTRKDLYVQNILTTEENVNVIRAIKDIKDDPSENIITISFLKEHEKKITEIIEKLDVDTLVNEGIYKVYTLKNAAADDVVKVLSDLFKEEIKMVRDDERNLVISEKLIKHITADKRTNSVILNADASVLSEIEVIINYLDNNVNIRIFPPRQIKVYKIKNHKAIDIKRHLDLFNTNQNALKIYSSVADERTNILIIVANIEDFNSIDLIINELDKNIESLAQRKMISKIYETRNRTPDYIIANLEKIITEGLYKNAINFIKMFAIEKQNKFVVLTDNPDILQTIQEWLEKLDNPEVSMQLIDRKELKTFVYYCKNTPAEDLANMLNTMISALKNVNTTANTPDILKDNSLMKYYISSISPNIVVTADKTSNSLLINATKTDYQNLLLALEEIDKIPDQIFIDVVIAEVKLSEQNDFGIEWEVGKSNTLSTNMNLRHSENLYGQALKFSGLRYAILDTKRFNAIMTWMTTNSQTKILSRPRITTAHNKKAVIKVGKEVPVTVVQQKSDNILNTNNIAYNQYTEFKDVGITLTVTPTSIIDNVIGLNLHLIVSEIDANAQVINVLNNPTINKREAETFGNVLSNNTIVIGGLIKQDETKNQIKVPVLSDIPLLGGLFKRTQTNKENTELLIFITPILTKSSNIYNATANIRQ